MVSRIDKKELARRMVARSGGEVDEKTAALQIERVLDEIMNAFEQGVGHPKTPPLLSDEP